MATPEVDALLKLSKAGGGACLALTEQPVGSAALLSFCAFLDFVFQCWSVTAVCIMALWSKSLLRWRTVSLSVAGRITF